MSDLIVSSLIALLVGSVGVLSYFLGRKVESNDIFEEKAQTAQEIRRIRSCIDNHDVVEQLHSRFKR